MRNVGMEKSHITARDFDNVKRKSFAALISTYSNERLLKEQYILSQ